MSQRAPAGARALRPITEAGLPGFLSSSSSTYGRALPKFAGAVAIGVEAAAALFIATGAIEALYPLLRRYNPHARATVLGRKEIWVRFAAWLLLALEFELAADVLQTAITPTWDDVGNLAAIAAIRTVLNFSLEKDLEKFAHERAGAP